MGITFSLQTQRKPTNVWILRTGPSHCWPPTTQYLRHDPSFCMLAAVSCLTVVCSFRGGTMTANEFFDQLDARIAKYDLLCHPFYKAWSAGTLTSEDLQIYGRDYFHHVAAFPVYLQEFGARAEDDQLRRAVEVNREDELGMDGARPHPELWLDFVEGMGGDRNASQHEPVAEITQLM